MKSLRLKSRKHSKSRKLTKGRKLRKGGNGPSSSSSSQVSLRRLFDLLAKYNSNNNNLIYFEKYPNQTDENDITRMIAAKENYKNRTLEIFRNNMVDISTISSTDLLNLLRNILSIKDEDVFNAFRILCSKIPSENQSEIYRDIEAYKNNISDTINRRGYAVLGELDNIDKSNELMEIIKNVIKDNAVMVNSIRAVKRGEEPGPVSKHSDHIGLFGPAFENTMGYLNSANYRNESSNPTNYDNVMTNSIQYALDNPNPIIKPDNSSSSSSEKGGRRTRRRKTMRRRK